MIFFSDGIQYLGFGVFNWADIFKNKSHKICLEWYQKQIWEFEFSIIKKCSKSEHRFGNLSFDGNGIFSK